MIIEIITQGGSSTRLPFFHMFSSICLQSLWHSWTVGDWLMHSLHLSCSHAKRERETYTQTKHEKLLLSSIVFTSLTKNIFFLNFKNAIIAKDFWSAESQMLSPTEPIYHGHLMGTPSLRIGEQWCSLAEKIHAASHMKDVKSVQGNKLSRRDDELGTSR